MIGSLLGHVASSRDGVVTIVVHGVGYEVSCAHTVIEQEDAHLYIHTHVTDGSITLFGFDSEFTRARFRRLIAIQGVGPRAARAVLSGMSRETFDRAAKEQDVKTFSRIDGVGPKTASRIVHEFVRG